MISVQWDGRQRVIGESRGEHLLARDAWWTTSRHLEGDEVRYDWLRGEERGALVESWLLGRVREKLKDEENGWSAPFGGYFRDLARTYSGYNPSLETLPDGTLKLTLLQMR